MKRLRRPRHKQRLPQLLLGTVIVMALGGCAALVQWGRDSVDAYAVLEPLSALEEWFDDGP